jgi:hypothetical protein
VKRPGCDEDVEIDVKVCSAQKLQISFNYFTIYTPGRTTFETPSQSSGRGLVTKSCLGLFSLPCLHFFECALSFSLFSLVPVFLILLLLQCAISRSSTRTRHLGISLSQILRWFAVIMDFNKLVHNRQESAIILTCNGGTNCWS